MERLWCGAGAQRAIGSDGAERGADPRGAEEAGSREGGSSGRDQSGSDELATRQGAGGEEEAGEVRLVPFVC